MSCYFQLLQQQMLQDDCIRDLAEGLQDMLAFVNECSDLRPIKGATDVIKEMSRGVLEAASLIDEYAKPSFAGQSNLDTRSWPSVDNYVSYPGRTARRVISVDLSNRIESCRKHLSELYVKFDRIVGVETRMIVKEMNGQGITQREIAIRNLRAAHSNFKVDHLNLLDRLPRVAEAKYDIGRCCLSDTRKEVIDTIMNWVSKTDDDANILWLHGLAGMGKSTVASSVSCNLNDRQWLGGTFFFSRDAITRCKPDQLFSTIAFQMASIDSSIRAAICGALTRDLDIGRSPVANQFEGLIKNTLYNAKELGHPLVILLDALDECGSERERKDLLAIIRTGLDTLPHFVKFVITSRPEVDIRAHFMSMGARVQSLDLSSIQSTIVDADILKFVGARMQDIAQLFELALDWPGLARRHALVQRAAGLFVWASTACEFIEDESSDPETQLNLILSGPNTIASLASPWTALDNLYLQVLRHCIPTNAPATLVTELRRVVGAIAALAVRISPLYLSQLLGLSGSPSTPDRNITRHILRKLHSVLTVPPTDDEALGIIHPSFVDFITDPSRCVDSRFYINLPEHRLHLAKRCLMRMCECLRRDICRLDAGSIMNADIPNLGKCLAEYIPGDLEYACCFWAEHLCRSVINEELYALVRTFISQHLLHWFEVMSLLGKHNDTPALLTLARSSLKVNFCIL
jgi:hypothetical protein